MPGAPLESPASAKSESLSERNNTHRRVRPKIRSKPPSRHTGTRLVAPAKSPLSQVVLSADAGTEASMTHPLFNGYTTELVTQKVVDRVC